MAMATAAFAYEAPKVTQTNPLNPKSAIFIGTAFSITTTACMVTCPDLNLYMPDKRHPSLMGTYLAANVVYASLFKKSPIGNGYTAGLDPSVAKHLQTVAWDTVKDFFKIQ
jgi:hypothetical protein